MCLLKFSSFAFSLVLPEGEITSSFVVFFFHTQHMFLVRCNLYKHNESQSKFKVL